MSVKVTIQNGSFQKPNGTLLANGTLVLRLSQDATVSATAQVVSKTPITITLDANGQAPATAVWGNDTLSPSGTVYYVDVFDSTGKPVANTQSWSVTGAGPIELNTMVRTDAGPTFPTPVLKAPAGDQTVATNNILPADGNTTQSLGSAAAPWIGTFKQITIETPSSTVLSENTDADTSGFLDINNGVVTHSSVQINNGNLALGKSVSGTKSAGIIFHDGNKNIVVQPGPRGKESTITAASITSNVLTITGVQLEAFVNGDVAWLSGMAESFLNGQIVTVSTSNGTTQFTAPFTHANFTNNAETGEAETGFLLANGTLVLPDVALGGSVDNSGYLLAIQGAAAATAGAGSNGLYYQGFGVLGDSGIGMNTHIIFPANTRQVKWVNGGNSIALNAAAATGARVITLPDATGNLTLESESIWTPVATGLTQVGGSATITGKYTKVGNIVFFTIVVTPVTNTSSVAGTTHFTLPTSPIQDSALVNALNDNTNIAIGTGGVLSGACYPPSWTTLTVPIYISGMYFSN